MATCVLVHGAWHTGDLLEDVAAPIREAGHEVHCPTMKGNAPGDAKDGGLDEAIASLVTYITSNGLSDIVLLGHSWGGMVITGAFDRLSPGTVKRLIYWSAFVPNDGESLQDMIPDTFKALFAQLAQPDGGLSLPFPIWREAFINDADAGLAQAAYERLNPHPYKCFTDPVRLKSDPATWEVGKSYIHCQEDVALPASLPWHPRLSEKLGLYRYVWMPGSHEVCFTDPAALAEKIMLAGRD